MSEASIELDEQPSSPRVQSVSRAMAILTSVATTENGLTAKEISEALGLSRPTTYHLLRTLLDDSFLFRGSDRRYRLGLRIGTLAEAFTRQLSPDPALAAHVRQLAEETGELSYLTVRRGLDIILLTWAAAKHAVRPATPEIGLLAHPHARASGKTSIAFATSDVREQFLRRPLARCTPNTITDPAELERQFEQIRADGYATNMEELSIGVCAMAAPLDGGASPFVLALSAPRDRFDEKREAYLDALLRAARAASSRPPANRP